MCAHIAALGPRPASNRREFVLDRLDGADVLLILVVLVIIVVIVSAADLCGCAERAWWPTLLVQAAVPMSPGAGLLTPEREQQQQQRETAQVPHRPDEKTKRASWMGELVGEAPPKRKRQRKS